MIWTARADAASSERVAAWLEESIQKSPDSLSLRFDLTNLRIMQGKDRDAEVILREILRRAPDKDQGGPLNNLAWLLSLRKGSGAEALQLVERAIALDGALPDYLDTRGLANLSLRRYGPAISDLQEVVAVAPAPDKLMHLARAYAAAGQRDQADSTLQAATRAGLRVEALQPIERESYRELVETLAQN